LFIFFILGLAISRSNFTGASNSWNQFLRHPRQKTATRLERPRKCKYYRISSILWAFESFILKHMINFSINRYSPGMEKPQRLKLTTLWAADSLHSRIF
jgi:hypothetical protein